VSAFLARRLAAVAVTLLGASLFVFGALALLGGDPTSSLLGTDATPQLVAAFRHELRLDQPLWQQYGTWVGEMVRGDFGTSVISDQDIGPQIIQRAQVTVPLAVFGMLIALAVAIPAGVISAARNRRASGILISVTAQLGLAVPAFWAGLMLASIFAVQLRWLPAGGFVRWHDNPIGSLRSLLLPALSIGIVQGAWLQRYVRTSVIEVMREDYIRTAQSKGMTRARALWSHGLRNAALSVVTVLGIQFGILLGGTVVIENVYFLPGMGTLVVDAVGQRDLVLVRSTVMVLIALVVLVNFVTDLLYGLLDPRTGASR
jgi:peptide/nickel transport system permease protein